jgi:hypothetical protein
MLLTCFPCAKPIVNTVRALVYIKKELLLLQVKGNPYIDCKCLYVSSLVLGTGRNNGTWWNNGQSRNHGTASNNIEYV